MADKRMGRGRALGKVILLGEHAVVYGVPALGVALSEGVDAYAIRSHPGRGHLSVPGWGLVATAGGRSLADRAFTALLDGLGAREVGVEVVGEPAIPVSAGLGASAALAVASARAIAQLLGRTLTDEEAAQAALPSEVVLHGGTPSGIDNALAAHGGVRWFKKGEAMEPVRVGAPLKLVIGDSGEPGHTAETVAAVARLYKGRRAEVEASFAELTELVTAAREALARGDREALGECMTENHATLQWLGVSTPALDYMVDAALEAGALGAKVTGGGGGGCAIALLRDDDAAAVEAAWAKAGRVSFVTEVRATGLRVLSQ